MSRITNFVPAIIAAATLTCLPASADSLSHIVNDAAKATEQAVRALQDKCKETSSSSVNVEVEARRSPNGKWVVQRKNLEAHCN